jgi:hypothetical protein
MKRATALVVAGLLASGCAGAYNAAQWRAHDAFQTCLRAVAGPGYSGPRYVSFDAMKDGTLVVAPFDMRFEECLRTKYPDVKVVGAAPTVPPGR